MHYFLFIITVFILVLTILYLIKKVRILLFPLFDSRSILIIFFFALLFCGFTWSFISVQTISTKENRNLRKWTPLKEISIIKVPEKIESYLNDHFGFRDVFIKIYRFVQFEIFNQSLSDGVIIGKNDWYFLYQAAKVDYIDCPMSKEEIIKTKVIDQINLLYNYLNKKGIKMVLIIVPSKPYIYPEYLPSWIDTTKNGRTTISNFKELVETHTNVPFLDLYMDIIEAKNNDKNMLYYKNDTHWNSVGAYYGLKSTTKFLLQNGIETSEINFNDYTIKKDRHKGDLSGLLAVNNFDENNGYFFNKKVSLKKIRLQKEARKIMGLNVHIDNWKAITTIYSTEIKPTGVVPIIAADSYFIASYFTYTMPFNKYYSMNYSELAEGIPFLIEQHEDPNVLILSFVDREFMPFVKSIQRWNPDSPMPYRGYGWEEELPY